MRPEQPIKFDEVMAISAKNKGEDIEILKERLRLLLDCYAEQAKESNDENADLYSKLTASVAERGPKVI